MKQVLFVKGTKQLVNEMPAWRIFELPAMLQGIQGDGSATIVIDSVPYRVAANRLVDPVTKRAI